MIVLFPGLRTQAAIDAIMAGGQVLEEWDKSYTYGPGAPTCFRGKNFVKLYDNDTDRLMATARRLGVRVIHVDRRGEPGAQHIDLVGQPMRRAIREAILAQ